MSYSQMVKMLREKHKEEIEFKFIINSKNKFSKVKFKIQTLDKQEIKVVGYNSIADFALKHLKKKDTIIINGRLNTKMEIEVQEFKIYLNSFFIP